MSALVAMSAFFKNPFVLGGIGGLAGGLFSGSGGEPGDVIQYEYQTTYAPTTQITRTDTYAPQLQYAPTWNIQSPGAQGAQLWAKYAQDISPQNQGEVSPSQSQAASLAAGINPMLLLAAGLAALYVVRK